MLLDYLNDLSLAWETLLLQLGEGKFPVEAYLEFAAPIGDQSNCYLLAERVKNGARHTDGLWGVVSVPAEDNLGLHWRSSKEFLETV